MKISLKSLIIFLLSLVFYSIETELAKILENNMNYNKPYFMLYLAHSTFILCLPLHLLLLKLTSNIPLTYHLKSLSLATRYSLTSNLSIIPSNNLSFMQIFPFKKFLLMVFALTFLATFSAICWWISISLTSVADLTAIWNSSAFWSYIFSIYILKEHLQKFKLLAVLLACTGVILIAVSFILFYHYLILKSNKYNKF